MLEIKDSVAVITGGGGGIGKTLAKYWVENGGKVLLTDVVPAPLEAAKKELEALGGQVATLVCSVTKEEDCADSKPIRDKLTELGITYITVNVPKEREKRREVFEASGQYFIPFLVDGEMVIANDPIAIVRYLSERYGGA